MRVGHWALVLSVRVASRRDAVGAASRREVLGIGHWLFLPDLLSSPRFPFGYAHGKPISHSATLTASPLPIPQLKDILKTLLANYALDKLKIEIAGIFTPSVPLPYPLGRTAPEVKRIFALTGSLCED